MFFYSLLRACQPMGCSPNVLRTLACRVLPNSFAGTGCSPLVLRALTLMGCPPIVLRACSLALYQVLPDCFASLLAHGVLPSLLSAGHGVLIAGAVQGALPGAPRLFRRRAHSWERFPISFLRCCWHELSFFCCWYCGPPLLPGNDVYGAWGARPV